MNARVQVIFYSMYGHVYKMAEEVAAGVHDAGADAQLYQVPELVPDEALERVGAKAARQSFAHLPVAKPEQMTEADAIIFGTPTRFGNMCAQMRNFLDQTGQLWLKGGLVGKVGSMFTSTATQHGGQETTITSPRHDHCRRALHGVRPDLHGRHHWRYALWCLHPRRGRRLPPAYGERAQDRALPGTAGGGNRR